MGRKFVKDSISCLLFLYSLSATASGQEEKCVSYYRHEVNVGVGAVFLHSSQYKPFDERIRAVFPVGSISYLSFDGVPGGVHLGYYYHLNERFSVGIMAAFLSYEESYDCYEIEVEVPVGEYWDVINKKLVKEYQTEKETVHKSPGYIKESSTLLLPSFKWNWVNCRWCSLYSKVYAGVHFQKFKFKSDIFPVEKTSKYDENKTYFTYAVTPIGWEIGRRNIRWFAEFSVGSNVNIQTGLTYRFGRYK